MESQYNFILNTNVKDIIYNEKTLFINEFFLIRN